MHTARLSKFPDPECVRAAIEHVPNIRDYEEWHWPEDGRPLESISYALRFPYNGELESVHLRLGLSNYGQEVQFVQSYLFTNKRPPQRAVDEARRLMRAVENELADLCHIPELTGRVPETCKWVKCR